MTPENSQMTVKLVAEALKNGAGIATEENGEKHNYFHGCKISCINTEEKKKRLSEVLANLRATYHRL